MNNQPFLNEDNFFKSHQLSPTGSLLKAKAMPIGTISKGRKKIGPNKWVPVKGAEKGKVDNDKKVDKGKAGGSEDSKIASAEKKISKMKAGDSFTAKARFGNWDSGIKVNIIRIDKKTKTVRAEIEDPRTKRTVGRTAMKLSEAAKAMVGSTKGLIFND